MLKLKRYLWCLIMCQICLDLSEAQGPKVCFPDGCVVGNTRPEGYDEFLGIPYAEPPVGELRYKNPVPIKKWSSVLNVKTPKKDCIQLNALTSGAVVSGDEDCLYLNVYRPSPTSSSDPKLPVIIYVHGGGWFAGTAAPFIHGPEYFMETKKVVMVFMAYRLGAMGFLSTGDDAISGNFGLKDQALAIEWTYKNIEHFGGDPNLMTCIGQSAGAGSCHMHLFNPKAAERLSRVVLMSGSAIAPWAYVQQKFPSGPKAMAKKFAKRAGISNAESLSSQELVTELRKINAVQIVEAHEKMKVWDVDRLVVFQPVIENCIEGAFLCEDQLKSWANGNYKKVPILIGNSDIEGGVRGLRVIENPDLVKSLNDNFDDLNELFFVFNPNATQKQFIYEKFKEVYYNGKSELNEQNKFGLVDAYTDRYFVQPVLKTVQQFLQNIKNPSVPIYVYKFNFKGPKSYSKLFVGNDKYYGVIHCDELLYTFKSPVFGGFPDDSVETEFRKYWIDFLIEFSITGKLQNHENCKRFTESFPCNCPYTYFYRETQTAPTFTVSTRYDLPLKVVPFINQLEGSDGPRFKCNISKPRNCNDKYCC